MASAFESAGNKTAPSRTLSEQGGRVVSEVQELGRVAMESASDAATHLRDKGRDAFAHGRERVTQAKGQFEGVVSANPMKSVLIAAGVGVALGVLLSRRSH